MMTDLRLLWIFTMFNSDFSLFTLIPRHFSRAPIIMAILNMRMKYNNVDILAGYFAKLLYILIIVYSWRPRGW